VQRILGNAVAIDVNRLRGVKTDPDFPRSAAIGFHSSQLEGLAVARPCGSPSAPSHRGDSSSRHAMCLIDVIDDSRLHNVSTTGDERRGFRRTPEESICESTPGGSTGCDHNLHAVSMLLKPYRTGSSPVDPANFNSQLPTHQFRSRTFWEFGIWESRLFQVPSTPPTTSH
jgi:hypothetical protein